MSFGGKNTASRPRCHCHHTCCHAVFFFHCACSSCSLQALVAFVLTNAPERHSCRVRGVPCFHFRAAAALGMLAKLLLCRPYHHILRHCTPVHACTSRSTSRTLSPCTTVLSFLPFTASLPDSLPDRFPPLPRHDAPHLASIVFNPGGGNYGDYGGGFMADSSQQQGGDAGGEASSRFHSPAAFAFPKA